jgi:hypothetical protein
VEIGEECHFSSAICHLPRGPDAVAIPDPGRRLPRRTRYSWTGASDAIHDTDRGLLAGPHGSDRPGPASPIRRAGDRPHVGNVCYAVTVDGIGSRPSVYSGRGRISGRTSSSRNPGFSKKIEKDGLTYNRQHVWFEVNLLVLAMGTLRLAMVAPSCEWSHGRVFFVFHPHGS